MSVIEEVLLEEHDRSRRISEAIVAELEELPRGGIRERIIKGRPYYYLQYREGDKVRSGYVPRDEVPSLRARLARRKELEAALKEQELARKQIERVLGRRIIDGRPGA